MRNQIKDKCKENAEQIFGKSFPFCLANAKSKKLIVPTCVWTWIWSKNQRNSMLFQIKAN